MYNDLKGNKEIKEYNEPVIDDKKRKKNQDYKIQLIEKPTLRFKIFKFLLNISKEKRTMMILHRILILLVLVFMIFIIYNFIINNKYWNKNKYFSDVIILFWNLFFFFKNKRNFNVKSIISTRMIILSIFMFFLSIIIYSFFLKSIWLECNEIFRIFFIIFLSLNFFIIMLLTIYFLIFHIMLKLGNEDEFKLYSRQSFLRRIMRLIFRKKNEER